MIWSRDRRQAAAVVEDLRSKGFDASLSNDLEKDIGNADVVTCATLANEPVVQGKWLRPRSHLDLIGSFTPTMREADDECFVGADIYVDTDEAVTKSGDLLGPMSRGVFAATDVKATLEELCRPYRTTRAIQTRTVFKSVGTALEDLAAATLVVNEGPKALR